jgi:menaquinone-dependent protoporphyrinogen oxidase
MKTLMIYSSKHGTTKECCYLVQENLTHDSQIISIDKSDTIDLSTVDNILIGSSVYAGKINKKLLTFINKNLAELKNKKLGVFLCCGVEKELDTYFNLLPSELIENAKLFYCGGKIDLEEHNFLVKFMLKKIMNGNKMPELKQETIEAIATYLNE